MDALGSPCWRLGARWGPWAGSRRASVEIYLADTTTKLVCNSSEELAGLADLTKSSIWREAMLGFSFLCI